MPQDEKEPPQLTLLLQQIDQSAPAQCSAAFAGIYDELRRIARQHLGQERIGHTLQATALVHEAWLRLFGTRRAFASGQEFLAAAANSMRRVLVDHARGKGRQKRRAAGRAVPLDAVALATANDPDHLLAVDEALTALEQQDPRLGEQARLRLFAGLDEAEIAATLAVSDRTVRRDWMFIRAFLQRQLDAEA